MGFRQKGGLVVSIPTPVGSGVGGRLVHRDLGQVDPGLVARCLALGATLKHQHVDHHIGVGARAHGAFGQSDGADQVGHAGDVLARGAARLVHGAGAGDEQRQTARPQPGDRTGDEVVVQPQAECGRCRIGAHDAIRERWIANGEVEAAGELAAGVVLAAYPRLGMHQAGDAGRHRIVLDAGQPAGPAQLLRQQREEQAGAHAGLEHAAAGEAEMLRGAPERADDRFRRVVRVLRRSLQGGVFDR